MMIFRQPCLYKNDNSFEMNRFFRFSKIGIGSVVTILIFCLFCRPHIEQPDEKILARIGNKSISLNEFIRRAEYTIRPAYCKKDNYIHKKIILNSLIAEKLFANEAGSRNILIENEGFQRYLRGRREQAMRQVFYFDGFHNKVTLDPEEVAQIARLSNREYQIAYFTVGDSAKAHAARKKLDNGHPFSEVFHTLSSLEEVPQRVVTWGTHEHAGIHAALYTKSLEKDQVVGPVQTDPESFTFIQIKGWIDHVRITEKEILEREEDVSEGLRTQYGHSAFTEYVKELMKGKEVTFFEKPFKEVVRIYGSVYFKSNQEKEDAFHKQFWQHEINHVTLDDFWAKLESIQDVSFLEIDGDVWTVKDLLKEMDVHPLVFRKKRMDQEEFAEQFKLAVVDLIRDKHITEDAYKKGYDKAPVVIRSMNMWQDSFLSIYHRNQYLESAGKLKSLHKNTLSVIKNVLNPYVDKLQNKYSKKIEIDMDAFEEIELTHIDAFMLQENVPFPVIVPNFPVLTTDHLIDYGKIMD